MMERVYPMLDYTVRFMFYFNFENPNCQLCTEYYIVNFPIYIYIYENKKNASDLET